MRLLDEAIKDLSDSVIPGGVIFKLYDTYGFPADLTGDIARERGLTLDEKGFEQAMNDQRERARASSKFSEHVELEMELDIETPFVGYDQLSADAAVIAIYVSGVSVDQWNGAEEALLVLDQTPFYAESGGQVGDKGSLKATNGSINVFDTTKAGAAILHHC